jgi:hypothetical protein
MQSKLRTAIIRLPLDGKEIVRPTIKKIHRNNGIDIIAGTLTKD